MERSGRPPDYEACSSEDLLDGIAEVSAVERVARRQVCDMVGVVDARRAWEIDGATSMEGWLAARLAVTFGHAAELVRVARALRALPAIAAVFAEGGLSWDQLVQLVRFATPESDAELAERAPGLSVGQLERMARIARANERKDREHSDPGTRRFLSIRPSKDRGWARGSFLLPADQAAVCETALGRLADAVFTPGQDNDPFEARMADALVELCSTRLATDNDADRATVVVHADLEVLAGLVGVAELPGGVLVTEDVLRRLMCDCRHQLVVDRPDGTTTFATDTRRSAPPWMNRQLRRRDGGCRFPGCGRRRWLHAHHVFVHWADGGDTEPWNLALLCGHHHRLLHEGGWTVTGRTDAELVFISPQGRRLTSRPATIPADAKRRLFADPPPEPEPPPDPPPDDDAQRLAHTLHHIAKRFTDHARTRPGRG